MKLLEFIKQHRERPSPLIRRIMLINVISLLLISMFNYLAIYNSNSRALIESVTAYNRRIAGMAFENIDKQIVQNIAAIPSLYFSDIRDNADILLPQTRDISQAPEKISALSSRMSEIYHNCPAILGIDIFYKATNTVASGKGNLHFAATEQDLERYLPWYNKFEAADRDAIVLPLSGDIYPGGEQVLTFVTRIKNSKWRGEDIVLAVHLSPASFSEYIDEQQGQFILQGADGAILYSTPGKAAPPSEIVRAMAAEPGVRDGLTERSVKLDGLDMMVSADYDPLLGVGYYHAIPYKVFFSDYNLQLRMLIISYLVSVLFTMAVLLLVSRLVNTAYQKRLTSASKNAGLELSGGKETFEGSLDTITSHLSSLNSAVRQTMPVLYQNYVRSLILGRHAGDAYEQLLPMLPYAGVLCVIVRLSPADSALVDLELISGALLSGTPDCALLLTGMEKNEIVIVASTEEEQALPVRHRLNERLDELFVGHFAADGMWLPRSEKNLKGAFDSAQDIYRYHFLFPQKSRLHFETLGPGKLKNSGSHLRLFDMIERDIQSENLLDLKERLYAITESFKFGSYGIDYCLSTLRDLVALLYTVTQSRRLDMWVVFGYDIRAHFKQIEDIDEFYRWSCDLCEVLMQNIRQGKKGLDPDLHSRIVELTEQNLENDISLEFLADRLGLRSDVLSRTFKKLMGKSYTDYIKEKKLARAEDLIADGLSMKEIARRLGYNSVQYFIKIFKESYGVTPYQYKKNGGAAK